MDGEHAIRAIKHATDTAREFTKELQRVELRLIRAMQLTRDALDDVRAVRSSLAQDAHGGRPGPRTMTQGELLADFARRRKS